MSYTTFNQTFGTPVATQSNQPAQALNFTQPIPSSGSLQVPPVRPSRLNKQTYVKSWRCSGLENKMRMVVELLQEKQTLGPRDKGSIKYRALCPLVPPEMWEQAQAIVNSSTTTATASLIPPLPALPSPMPIAMDFNPVPASTPVYGDFNTLPASTPVYGTGTLPEDLSMWTQPSALAQAEAPAQIWAAGDCQLNQFLPVATEHQQQFQTTSTLSLRRNRSYEDDNIEEAPRPKRQHMMTQIYTPPPPTQPPPPPPPPFPPLLQAPPPQAPTAQAPLPQAPPPQPQPQTQTETQTSEPSEDDPDYMFKKYFNYDRFCKDLEAKQLRGIHM